MMWLRKLSTRGFAFLASLAVAAAIFASMASSTRAALSTLLPPWLQPIETNLSAGEDLEDLVFGESQIATNPKNPKNIVYMSLTHHLSQACEDSGAPECQQVNRIIRDGPVALPIGPGPAGFFLESGFAHNTLFVTLNRGKSWKAVVAPCCPPDHPEMDNQGDPSITATADGTFYIVWDSINWGDDPNNTLPNGGVAASKSTDGGLTWSTPVLTLTAMDGPKVIADPNTGRVYAHSSGAIGTRTATGNPADPLFTSPIPNDRYVAASSDGVSWTPPQRFGGTNGTAQFSAAGGLAAAHGVIATAARFTSDAACNFFVGLPQPCIVFSTSTNDGQTWTRRALNAPDLTPPAGLPPGGGGILVAADPTKPSHFTVAGFRPAGGFAVYQTPDSGATWTGPAVVNDSGPDFGKTRAAMAYSLDGVVGMMWRAYTEAQSGGQIAAPFAVWVTISDDGGATFENPIQVSDVSPKPPRPGFHNNADHYSGIAFSTTPFSLLLMNTIGQVEHQGAVTLLRRLFGADKVYASWADSRTAERAAFMGEIRVLSFFHESNQ